MKHIVFQAILWVCYGVGALFLGAYTVGIVLGVRAIWKELYLAKISHSQPATPEGGTTSS